MKRVNTNPHIEQHVLKRNKNFPNSKLPVLIYREALHLPTPKRKAVEVIQKLLHRNGWSNSWTNGIYDFHHYHSITHEVMAVASGDAQVILGGPKGKSITIEKGDVIILPAGAAHRCSKHSPDFQCIGAYPQGKNYDINLGRAKELDKAMHHIKTLALPQKDPVYGKEGFLKTFWKT